MMEFSGEYQVPALPETIWGALTDPEVLQACVPGCESVEKTGEWSYKASCKLRMGPVSLNMSGDMRLEDPKPPFECRIVGEGRDRAAGHAKGEATVSIAPDEDGSGCIVRYSAKAVVGGRLAQVGGRLIDAAVKKYADEFFSAFAEYLGGRRSGAPTESEASAGEETTEAKERRIKTVWVIWGAVAVILLLLFLSGGAE